MEETVIIGNGSNKYNVVERRVFLDDYLIIKLRLDNSEEFEQLLGDLHLSHEVCFLPSGEKYEAMRFDHLTSSSFSDEVEVTYMLNDEL